MSHPDQHSDYPYNSSSNQDIYETTMQQHHIQSSYPSEIVGGCLAWDHQPSPNAPIMPVQQVQIQPQPSFSDLMRELGHEQSAALHEAARRAPPNINSVGPLVQPGSSATSSPPVQCMPSPPFVVGSTVHPPSDSHFFERQQVQPPAPNANSFEMFSCDGCSASFSRKHDLERHRRGHSGDAPYNCEGCGASFTRSDGRGRHWKLQPHCERLHLERGGSGKRRGRRISSGGVPSRSTQEG